MKKPKYEIEQKLYIVYECSKGSIIILKANIICVKIYKDKITEVISEDDYLAMQAEFQSELDEVQKKKQAIEEKIAQKKGALENDELKALVEDFVTLKEPTPLLLHQLIEKITIDESKNITIFYAFQELKGLSDKEAVAE